MATPIRDYIMLYHYNVLGGKGVSYSCDRVLSCRIEHLGVNVALQLLVGVPLEMVHGALRVGFVYVAGVLAGELSHWLLIVSACLQTSDCSLLCRFPCGVSG